jgi:hypothetical protein
MKYLEWHPYYPVTTYSQLCTGPLIILIAVYVIYRVHKGSQSKFVYTLMAFSIMIGAAYMGLAVSYSLCFSILWSSNIYHVASLKFIVQMRSFYFITALQPFVFGMRYLQSATRCALSKPCATLKCIHYVTITVVVLYSIAIIGTMLVMVLTFPGWDCFFEDYDKFMNWS